MFFAFEVRAEEEFGALRRSRDIQLSCQRGRAGPYIRVPHTWHSKLDVLRLLCLQFLGFATKPGRGRDFGGAGTMKGCFAGSAPRGGLPTMSERRTASELQLGQAITIEGSVAAIDGASGSVLKLSHLQYTYALVSENTDLAVDAACGTE